MTGRSILRTSLSFLLLVWLLNGCGPTECAEDIETWIDEAPTALNEFLMLRKEVLADTTFFVRHAIQGKVLILDPRDTVEYATYGLPRVMAWFRSGKSYIRIGEDYTEFYFRQCRNGRYSANGMVYLERMQHSWSVAVERADSADLGDGWHAYVTTCVGCGAS